MSESLVNVLLGGAITAVVTIVIWSVKAAWSARGTLEKQSRDFSTAVAELRAEITNLRHSLEEWTREQMSSKFKSFRKEFREWAQKEFKIMLIEHMRECNEGVSGVYAPKVTQKVPKFERLDSDDDI